MSKVSIVTKSNIFQIDELFHEYDSTRTFDMCMIPLELKRY